MSGLGGHISSTQPDSAQDGAPPFGSILCAVDGSPSAAEAARQAISLSGPATALLFVCVADTRGVGASAQATISASRADAALQEAAALAREEGVEAATEILHGRNAAGLLIEASTRSDLLVVASHGASRAGGILLGGTASAAVHRAPVPVLVARRPPDGVAFPDRIMVASDGSPDARRAVHLAARLGRRRSSTLLLLHVGAGQAGQLPLEALEPAAARELEHALLERQGDPADEILAAASAESVSLLAIGSRGLKGLPALGSVSERVSHRARCSVLVARPAR